MPLTMIQKHHAQCGVLWYEGTNTESSIFPRADSFQWVGSAISSTAECRSLRADARSDAEEPQNEGKYVLMFCEDECGKEQETEMREQKDSANPGLCQPTKSADSAAEAKQTQSRICKPTTAMAVVSKSSFMPELAKSDIQLSENGRWLLIWSLRSIACMPNQVQLTKPCLTKPRSPKHGHKHPKLNWMPNLGCPTSGTQ